MSSHKPAKPSTRQCPEGHIKTKNDMVIYRSGTDYEYRCRTCDEWCDIRTSRKAKRELRRLGSRTDGVFTEEEAQRRLEVARAALQTASVRRGRRDELEAQGDRLHGWLNSIQRQIDMLDDADRLARRTEPLDDDFLDSLLEEDM